MARCLRVLALWSLLPGCPARAPDCEQVCTNVTRVMTADCTSDCDGMRKSVKGACIRLDCPKWPAALSACMAKAEDSSGMERCARVP